MVFQRVSQTEPLTDPVMILSPDAISFEVAPLFEIDHDPLDGAFSDQHLGRDVTNADAGRTKDAMQDVRVIA